MKIGDISIIKLYLLYLDVDAKCSQHIPSSERECSLKYKHDRKVKVRRNKERNYLKIQTKVNIKLMISEF